MPQKKSRKSKTSLGLVSKKRNKSRKIAIRVVAKVGKRHFGHVVS